LDHPVRTLTAEQEVFFRKLSRVRDVGSFSLFALTPDLPYRRVLLQRQARGADAAEETTLRMAEISALVRVGRLREALQRVERAQRRLDGRDAVQERWRVRYCEAWVRSFAGERGRAEEILRQVGPCFRDAGRWDDAASTWLLRVHNAIVEGRLDEGVRLGEEALAYTERGGEHCTISRVANDVAACHLLMDRDAEALPLYRKTFEHALRAKDQRFYGAAVGNIAMIYYRRGWFQSAIRLFHDARSSFREHELPGREAYMLSNLATCCVWTRDKREQGLVYLEEALAINRRLQHPVGLDMEIDIALNHDRFGNRKVAGKMATRILDQPVRNFRYVPGREAWLGYLAMRYGRPDDALRCFGEALALCRRFGQDAQGAMVRYFLILLGLRHPDLAAECGRLSGLPPDDYPALEAELGAFDAESWHVYHQLSFETIEAIAQLIDRPALARWARRRSKELLQQAAEADLQRMLSRFPMD
jgi:tetratricopeptide (TPR) repeat protein